jgi:hypothetical protein
MSLLWPKGQRGMTMENFLADDRLERWYLQNYDAVGCNIYTCSSLNATRDKYLLDKLFPIPIGLDLHTFGGPIVSVSSIRAAVSPQLEIITAIKSIKIPFLDRLNRTLVDSFECSFSKAAIGIARAKQRGRVCELLRKPQQYNISLISINGISVVNDSCDPYVKDKRLILSRNLVLSKVNSSQRQLLEDIIAHHNLPDSNRWPGKELKRISFWMTLATAKYSIAPPGYGMDTHRLWEILQFGCVPVVVTSPLDKLYSKFPIIILKNWDELLEPNIVERFDSEIYLRFGNNPMNDTIQKMLTLEYWKSVVANEVKL